MAATRPKSDLLKNIETLWNEASMQLQNNTNQQATSTYQRINVLMQDALIEEQAANYAGGDADCIEDDIDTLALLVQDAATQTNLNDDKSVSTPLTFDLVKSQMEDVSRLKPPQENNSNISSVEYFFGQAFTNLVRHVVRDYIHNKVETVIRNAISSELDTYDAQQNNKTHKGDHGKTHD